jgi:hypothetical protein
MIRVEEYLVDEKGEDVMDRDWEMEFLMSRSGSLGWNLSSLGIASSD